jgi:hypothetical protein
MVAPFFTPPSLCALSHVDLQLPRLPGDAWKNRCYLTLYTTIFFLIPIIKFSL